MLRALSDYCDATGVGEALASPADISLTESQCYTPAMVRELPDDGMRSTMRRHFQETGVPVYWIVVADQHLVEVWTPDAAEPAIEREAVTWSPMPGIEPLRLPVERLFR